MEDKIKLLAKWLKDYSTYNDVYTEGKLESALRLNKDETIQKIGDYLEEILQMDEKQVQDNLED